MPICLGVFEYIAIILRDFQGFLTLFRIFALYPITLTLHKFPLGLTAERHIITIYLYQHTIILGSLFYLVYIVYQQIIKSVHLSEPKY